MQKVHSQILQIAGDVIIVEAGNVKVKCSFLNIREIKSLLKIIRALQDYYDRTSHRDILYVDPLDWFKKILMSNKEKFDLSYQKRTITFEYDTYIMNLGGLL